MVHTNQKIPGDKNPLTVVHCQYEKSLGGALNELAPKQTHTTLTSHSFNSKLPPPILQVYTILLHSRRLNRHKDFDQSGQGWDEFPFPNLAPPFSTHGDHHM